MAEKTNPNVPDKKKTSDIKKHSEDTRQEEKFLSPAVDIYETEDKLVVLADIPGVEKDDMEVHVDNNILTIKGKCKPLTKGDTFYKEYELCNYFRQFELSEEVNQDKISGELKHGVLTISIPKAEKPKPKQIAVNIT